MSPTIRAPYATAICLSALSLLATAVATVPAAAHGTKTKTLEIVHPWCFDRFDNETRDVVVGMTIRNVGPRDEALVSARMPSGEKVEVVAVSAGSSAAAIAIPRGGSIDLHKAAAHLRIVGLKRSLVNHATFPLTLVFKHAGAIKVDVMVEETVK